MKLQTPSEQAKSMAESYQIIKEQEEKNATLNSLIYERFSGEQGKMLLNEFRQRFIEFPIYPIRNSESLAMYGGSNEIYMGFRSGQANVVHWIEARMQMHVNRQKFKDKEELNNE